MTGISDAAPRRRVRGRGARSGGAKTHVRHNKGAMPRCHRTDPNYPRVKLVFAGVSSSIPAARAQIQRAFDQLGLPASWTEQGHSECDAAMVLVNEERVEVDAAAIVAAIRGRVSRF